jgi:hypothetical protein
MQRFSAFSKAEPFFKGDNLKEVGRSFAGVLSGDNLERKATYESVLKSFRKALREIPKKLAPTLI